MTLEVHRSVALLWVLFALAGRCVSCYAWPEVGQRSLGDKAAAARAESSAPGFDPAVGSVIDGRIGFSDESGRSIELRRYLYAHPTVLVAVYYGCSNICSVLLSALVKRLQASGLHAGSDFELVAVSIDPADSPAAAKRTATALAGSIGLPSVPPGWHFLTGQPMNIERFTRSIGFRYGFDPQHGEYVHPAGIVLVTAQGRIARYLPGLDWSAQSLRLGLLAAAADVTESRVESLWLLCRHLGFDANAYAGAPQTALRIGGGITAAALGGLILLLVRRERRSPPSKRAREGEDASP